VTESQYGGVPSGHEGIVLQRGGEELLLEKLDDRFTLCPDDPQVKVQEILHPDHSSWPEGLEIIAQTPIATTNLIEIQVNPRDLEAALAAARSHPQIRFASHVYHLSQDPETVVYVRDQVTAQFAAQVSPDQIQTITESLGLYQPQSIRGMARTFCFRVGIMAQENPIKLANRLQTHAEVLLAETNVIIRHHHCYRPQDDRYPQQWYLQNQGGLGQSEQAHIDIERAWDISRGDRAIVIAVTDDSIDLNHPDFQGSGKIVAPRDLADQDFLPLPELTTDNHGTAVAGVAVAEENGRGIVGVAPDCALMPIRTTGFLDDESIETLFHWATDHGAAVMCCSWGPGALRFPLSLRQRAAITEAATMGRGGKGCVIVFAAGNFNRPLNATTHEAGWPDNALGGETTWLNGFAIHPDVITVSACTSLAQKAAYSNWGAEIFISAPSNNGPPVIWLPQTGFIQTPPAITTGLRGNGVVTTDRTGDLGYTPSDFTDTFGGTSSAAPVVAGVVGLILSVNPQLTVREVKDILRQTADKIVDPEPDPQLQLRLGTYENDGHSPWFGYGKVNAFRAVQAAQQRLKSPAPAQRQVKQVSLASLSIPDPGTISSELVVTETGQLQTIAVEVAIDHEFLGDLEIWLIAPSQAPNHSPNHSPNHPPILLQDRTLGRQTRLQQTYTLETTPTLRYLLDQPIQGTWILQVRDWVPKHTGILNQWTLHLGV
jgi:subtilisin family serine protease